MLNKRDSIKNLIIIILILIIVCGGMFFASLNSSDENKNAEKDDVIDTVDLEAKAQAESDAIDENEMKELNEIDFSQYMDLYNDSIDHLVLIARPTCQYCQIAEPIIRNIAYQYDLTINYLNTDSLSDADQADLVRSNDYFKDFGTPTILLVSNGNIKNKLEGLTTSDYYIEFFKSIGFISK